MKNLEYSPFPDVYVPYIQYPALPRVNRLQLIWESIRSTPMPFFTRWVIYQALRQK